MNKESKGFLKGALVGGIVAGVSALLFAPKSGKETRQDIKKAAKTASDRVQAELTHGQQELQAKLGNVKAMAKDLKGEAAEDAKVLIKKAEALRDDMKVAASNIGDAAADMRDEVSDNAKVLLKSSGEVLAELEKFSKKMASSTKAKAKNI